MLAGDARDPTQEVGSTERGFTGTPPACHGARANPPACLHPPRAVAPPFSRRLSPRLPLQPASRLASDAKHPAAAPVPQRRSQRCLP